MRPKIVAGNWKMHGTRESAEQLATGLAKLDVDADVVVFPPYVYLDVVAKAAPGLKFGAQDVAVEVQGAFTGEVSAEMLADVGCAYVLVGHSERRSLYAESNEVVAQKFLAALRAGLTPMLCVGESLVEREQGQAEEVVFAQLQAVLDVAGADLLAKSVIAYEPVWAIGTGLTASPEQAQQMHQAIRNWLRKQLGAQADSVAILYGGSVKAENAAEIFAQPDVDGGLVGGASLKLNEFIAICRARQ
ncbi:triose-phosphate isomerase [Balneatrix alpica]|uniref:Triosephosphate isomerase n=1 Tax=Balneatrix alpica TaxID=75684 RepID=A0ABV5ZEN0_9GAMM|nr:triose-phosphate isomerase [Balneatrix alpica]